MAVGQPAVRIVLETDPAVFVERVGDFLREHPVEHSVLLTRSAEGADGTAPSRDARDLWLWAEDVAGRVVGAAMQTPPYPMQLSLGVEGAVAQLADAAWRVRPHLPGVGGMVPAPEVFAARWLALGGPAAETGMREGVYVATSVRAPVDVPGRERLATPQDRDRLAAWADAFGAETGTGHPGEDLVAPRLAAGRLHVWEDGDVVAMAAVTAAFGGVSRVQLVYTPPEHRRRSYAAALVAAVTAREVAAGRRCMLYTDLANATSNRVYQRVGYHWVGEARSLVFVASPTSVPAPRRAAEAPRRRLPWRA